MEVLDLNFESGAMSIVQMGEELMGHPSMAINELVKNAYDADADVCRVFTYYDTDIKQTFLIIQDNGIGMNEHTLFGPWLTTSISSKRNEDKEKRKSQIYERRFLGQKGIGRLAAMALGKYLTVVTKTNIDKQYNWLRINRDQFKKETLLQDIKFPGGKIGVYNDLFDEDKWENERIDFNNYHSSFLQKLLKSKLFGDFLEGTLLIIENLDDAVKTIIEEEFNQMDLEDTAIFKSLRDLITPLRQNKTIQDDLIKEEIIDNKLRIDNGESLFDLYYGINLLDSENIEELFVPVEPSKIIEYYDYRIYGKVSQDVNVKGKYVCKRFVHDSYEENFNIPKEYLLSDYSPSKRNLIKIADKYENSNVGEFFFDIRVFDLDGDAKDSLADNLKVKGRRKATDTLRRYLGLKISKNGFGVKPYGEEEQDWLGLGAKRVQKHQVTIGPNQILGNIFLYSPQNDRLDEKTNREGFFNNKAFITFKKIIDGILVEAGRRRSKYRIKHNLGRNTKSTLERPDTTAFFNSIKNFTDNKAIISKTKKFIEDTSTALDNMEYSLTFSQRLATLGRGLELVYHELSQPITSLGGTTKSLIRNINKCTDEEKKSILLERTDNLQISVEHLETLKNSLQPAIGKSLPKKFKPLDIFLKVCLLFKADFQKLNITREYDEELLDFEIKDYEYVFWVTILNIINNAIYWLKMIDGERRIIFQISKDKDIFIISNTSPKIPTDDLETIFNYGITGKKEKSATGLGLSFTQSLLNSRDWKIWSDNLEYGPAFFIQKITKDD